MEKHVKARALVGSVLGAAVFAAVATMATRGDAATDEKVDLFCRGGGDTTLKLEFVNTEVDNEADWGPFQGLYNLFSSDKARVIIGARFWFKKAPERYNGSLQPGQCTLLDRPVSAAEANIVGFAHSLNGYGDLLFIMFRDGKPSTISGYVPDEDRFIQEPKIKALKALLDPNKIVQFRAKLAGSGFWGSSVENIIEVVPTGQPG